MRTTTLLLVLVLVACGDNDTPPTPESFDPTGTWAMVLLFNGDGSCPGGTGEPENRTVTVTRSGAAYVATGQLSDETVTGAITADETSGRIDIAISIPITFPGDPAEHTQLVYTIDATTDETFVIGGAGMFELGGRFACSEPFLVGGELRSSDASE